MLAKTVEGIRRK